jgi:antitoxin component YwqK of YwqJK toxin-antitoxin module
MYVLGQEPLNKTDEKGRKQGFWRKMHPNGQIRYEGNFKNDNPEGIFQYYQETGKLKMVCFYYANGQRSRAKGYGEKGTIISDGNYIKQLKDSIWTYYDEQYRVISRETYRNGIKEGTWFTYYPNGVIAESVNYSNNKKNGVLKQNFEDGKPSLTGNFKDGLLHGKLTYYHPNGEVKLTGIYTNDVREGAWFTFSENGNLIDTEVFKNGVSNKPPVLHKYEKLEKDENEILVPNHE